MYLTRLRLDPRSALARRDLADPYEMHRTLVRPFVKDAEQVPPRILWRAEPTAAWSAPEVLVQSEHEADWGLLQQQLPGYMQSQKPWEAKVMTPENWLQHDQCYRFRLFANPTVARDGKRQGLASEEAQLAWLMRQGERHGFEAEAALVTGSEVVRSRKQDSRISLLKVCFEGRLRVRDRMALAAALRAGIGPGKAFGCGLLSLGRG